MPTFVWEGKNRNNILQKGEMEAAGMEAVRINLGRLRIVPTKIKKKPKDLFENISFLQPKVTKKDVQKANKKLKSVGSVETSAKTGDKVNEAFLAVIKGIVEKKQG